MKSRPITPWISHYCSQIDYKTFWFQISSVHYLHYCTSLYQVSNLKSGSKNLKAFNGLLEYLVPFIPHTLCYLLPQPADWWCFIAWGYVLWHARLLCNASIQLVKRNAQHKANNKVHLWTPASGCSAFPCSQQASVWVKLFTFVSFGHSKPSGDGKWYNDSSTGKLGNSNGEKECKHTVSSTAIKWSESESYPYEKMMRHILSSQD